MDRNDIIAGDRLWGARRIQPETFNRLMAGIALAISSVWLGWWAAAIALPFLAYVVARSRRRDPRPVVPPGFTLFGSHRFPLTIEGAADQSQAVLREMLGGAGPLELSVWLVGWDDAGFPWTLVRRTGTRFAPTMTFAGTPGGDPFAMIQNNLAVGLDVATVHTRLLGVGRHADAAGEVAVFSVECSLPASQLAAVSLDGDEAVFTEVHPESVARLMAASPAAEWPGSAALGLVALVEDYYPASSPQIERYVEEGWRTARQFGRLERLTDPDQASVPKAARVPAPLNPPVVLTVERGEVVETIAPRRYPVDYVLTWEVPTRAVPNRY
jgi:hypothetical protein